MRYIESKTMMMRKRLALASTLTHVIYQDRDDVAEILYHEWESVIGVGARKDGKLRA